MPEFIFELGDALYNEETGKAVFKPKIVGKLVRCKDCVYHGEFNESGWCTCEITGTGMHKDGFCSDGEKTDNT